MINRPLRGAQSFRRMAYFCRMAGIGVPFAVALISGVNAGPAPVVTPSAADSAIGIDVTVTCPTADEIRYTLNGSDPTRFDHPISSGTTITISRSATLKVAAWESDVMSDIVEESYRITGEVASGTQHGVAISVSGKAWSWGQQLYGRLGNGSATSSLVVTPIEVLAANGTDKFETGRAVAAGHLHTLIVTDGGKVAGFGHNGFGALGDNSTTHASLPVLVLKSTTAGDYLTNCVGIAAGEHFSIAVDTAGDVFSWGLQSGGRLGNGSTFGTQQYAQAVEKDEVSYPDLDGIAAVAAGAISGYALEPHSGTGRVWSWGGNASGQLGQGSTSASTRSKPVLLNSTTELTDGWSIAAGEAHLAIVRWHATDPDLQGTVWTCGNRGNGRLGQGSTAAGSITYPAKVMVDATTPLEGVTQVAAGAAHTLALDENGNVWSWGYNGYGQLGDGSTTQSGYAVKVRNPADDGDLEDIVMIAAGGDGIQGASMAVAEDGTIYVWGRNNQGQLGNGATSLYATPLPVAQAQNNIAEGAPSLTLACEMMQPEAIGCIRLAAVPSHSDGVQIKNVKVYCNGNKVVDTKSSDQDWPGSLEIIVDGLGEGSHHIYGIVQDANDVVAMSAAETVVIFDPAEVEVFGANGLLANDVASTDPADPVGTIEFTGDPNEETIELIAKSDTGVIEAYASYEDGGGSTVPLTVNTPVMQADGSYRISIDPAGTTGPLFVGITLDGNPAWFRYVVPILSEFKLSRPMPVSGTANRSFAPVYTTGEVFPLLKSQGGSYKVSVEYDVTRLGSSESGDYKMILRGLPDQECQILTPGDTSEEFEFQIPTFSVGGYDIRLDLVRHDPGQTHHQEVVYSIPISTEGGKGSGFDHGGRWGYRYDNDDDEYDNECGNCGDESGTETFSYLEREGSMCASGYLNADSTSDMKVDASFGMGTDAAGAGGAAAKIRANDLEDPIVGTPESMTVEATEGAAITAHASGDYPSQIATESGTTYVSTSGSNRYKLSFHGPGWPTATSSLTVVRESPGGQEWWLRLIENRFGGTVVETRYEQVKNSDGSETWTILEGAHLTSVNDAAPSASAFLRKTIIEKGAMMVDDYSPLTGSFTAAARGWTETVEQADKRADTGAWETVKVTANHYKKFSWGSPCVSQVLDPTGRALGRQWGYHGQANDYPDSETTGLPANIGCKRGLIAGQTSHDNYWQRFDFDAHGRITEVASPFQSSSPESAATTGDVWSFAYGTNERRDTRTIEGVPVTENLISGAPVSGAGTVRSIHRLATISSDGTGAGDQTTTITRAPVATAANYTGYEADSNRITRIDRPDETVHTCVWSFDGTSRVQDCKDGNASLTRGTRTKTWTDSTGNKVKVETYALDFEGTASNAKLLKTVTQSNFDGLSRPLTTTTTFEDGSPDQVETRTYSCCGLAGVTDYKGIVSSYTYDHLKRRTTATRSGLTHTTEFNGRTVRRLRSPQGGGSTMVLGETTTNEAGEITVSKSPSPQSSNGTSLVATTYTYTYGAGSFSRDQLNPDGGTIKQVWFLDGRPCYQNGTATNAMSWEWTTDPSVTLLHGAALTKKTIYGSILTSGSQWEIEGYDLLGRVVELHYADGAVASRHYLSGSGVVPGKGKIAKSIDADGVTTLFGYNDEAQLVFTASDLNGNGTLDLGTDRVSWGQTDVGTAPDATTYATATVSKVFRSGDTSVASAKLVEETYQAIDGLESWSVPFGISTRQSRTEVSLAGSGVWSVQEYAPDGHLESKLYFDNLLDTLIVDGPSPGTTMSSVVFNYDDHNRLEEYYDSRLKFTSYTYNNNDQVTVKRRERGAGAEDDLVTSMTYDAMGRTLTVNSPDTLDSDGGTLTNIVTKIYDKRGNVKSVSGDQTYERHYTYDALSRLATQMSYYSESPTTQYTEWLYDSERGWLVEKNYPGENDTETSDPDYGYTDAGRLKFRDWERGVTSTYHYDFEGENTGFGTSAKAGDFAGITYSDSTPSVSHTYHRWGAPAGTTDVSGTREYGYRESIDLALETEETSASGVPPGGVTVPKVCVHDYDAIGRLEGFQCGDPAGGTPDHAVQYGYNFGTGRIASIIHGDSTVSISESEFFQTYVPNSNLPYVLSGPVHKAVWTWEEHRNVLKQRESVAGATNFATVRYGDSTAGSDAVNAIGQRLEVHYSGDLFTGASPSREGYFEFGYNLRGELVESVRRNTGGTALPGEDSEYAFDAIGNRLEASIDGSVVAEYVPDARNQYDSIDEGSGPVSRIHDLDGNLTDDGTKLYSWDAENRLREVRNKSDNGLIASYLYDHLSRRIYKQTSSPQGTSERVFHYEGWNLSAEYAASSKSISGSTAALRTYTWGLDLSGSIQGAGGVGGLLAIEEKSGTHSGVHYPLYDGNGNVLGTLKDSGSGTIVSSIYEYDAFGNITRASGSYASENPMRFSTKYRNSETGFYYYGYRYYDPITGRWPSRDPIGERGGVNLYGFVGNSPMVFVDLFGLRACPCKCDDAQKDLKEEINKYVNDAIKKANGNAADLSKALVTNDSFTRGVIEDWVDEHHKADTRGKSTTGLAPCIRLCGECVGTDKLTHFFEFGKIMHDVKKAKGEKFAEGLNGATEGLIPEDPDVRDWIDNSNDDISWESTTMHIDAPPRWLKNKMKDFPPHKPVGNADMEANRQGMRFFEDLDRQGLEIHFNICDYVNENWDENHNPNTDVP